MNVTRHFISTGGIVGAIVSAVRHRDTWLCDVVLSGLGGGVGTDNVELPLDIVIADGQHESVGRILPWQDPIIITDEEKWDGPVGPESREETICRVSQNRIWLIVDAERRPTEMSLIGVESVSGYSLTAVNLQLSIGTMADTADYCAYCETAMRFGATMSHGDPDYLSTFMAGRERERELAGTLEVKCGHWFPVEYEGIVSRRQAAFVRLEKSGNALIITDKYGVPKNRTALWRSAMWFSPKGGEIINRPFGVCSAVDI